MPDIHTHPNGYTVQRNSVGASIVNRGEDYKTPLNADQVDALRDYLLDELGLWRDDETGALVVTGSWDGTARVIFPDGDHALGILDGDAPDRYDAVVARWRAALAPPPREPKPGEVWRITLDDGSECNALVGVVPTGAPVIWRTAGGGVLLDTCPADRRRLLVEADGTVVSDE